MKERRSSLTGTAKAQNLYKLPDEMGNSKTHKCRHAYTQNTSSIYAMCVKRSFLPLICCYWLGIFIGSIESQPPAVPEKKTKRSPIANGQQQQNNDVNEHKLQQSWTCWAINSLHHTDREFYFYVAKACDFFSFEDFFFLLSFVLYALFVVRVYVCAGYVCRIDYYCRLRSISLYFCAVFCVFLWLLFGTASLLEIIVYPGLVVHHQFIMYSEW